jgi:hypothetical protein
MKLRRKPSSLTRFPDRHEKPQPACQEQEQDSCFCIHEFVARRLITRTDVVRFDFQYFGVDLDSPNVDRSNCSDFAVDVTWHDIIEIIRRLAIAARQTAAQNAGASTQTQRRLTRIQACAETPSERDAFAAITAIAKQLGINTDHASRECLRRSVP